MILYCTVEGGVGDGSGCCAVWEFMNTNLDLKLVPTDSGRHIANWYCGCDEAV